ncbi:hypothetical protein F4802DRAFT_367896 [Xylaria palmicola]|nr:hypothetical protein F4802DRAFT_367896 [Xylaria palmicola]
MRSSKPVCLLCRLQVAQATCMTRAVQWQTQTVRLSTSSPRRDTPGAGSAPADDAVVPGLAPSQSQSPPFLRRVLSEKHRSKPDVRISQTNRTAKQRSSRVDALFQEILEEQQGLRGAAGHAPTHEAASVDLSLVKAIGKLQEMVDKDIPVTDAYSYFRTEIYPAVQVPGTHVPQAYHKVKFALLEKVVVAKEADMFTEELPAVADIFRMYAEVGELKPKRWTKLVGELTQTIVNMDLSAETQAVLEYERHRALRQAMLADLVESWKVLSLPRLAISPEGESKLTSGFWFPRLDKFSLRKYATKGNFARAFSTLFPQYPPNQLGAPAAVLAIATYALLHDTQRCSAPVRKNATRFMSKVAYLVTFVDYRDEALQKDLVGTFPGLEGYIMGLWPKIKAHFKQHHMSDNASSTEVHRISVSNDRNRSTKTFNPASIGRRLNQPLPVRNAGEVDRLWEEFVGAEKPMSEERANQIRQQPHLIDAFIKARITLNQPEMAIAAWNLLSTVGLKPSLRTWNLMLDGLRKAGNVDGIKNIWAKLAKSGLKLDTAIWTTRIVGLIDCGDIEGGLQALEEMVRLSERDANKTAVMPSIAPVNGALAGLIRCKQHGIAENLLAWAATKGIEPDTVTFNTMLRSFIRIGDRDEDIERLFSAMKAKGIPADEATFTIILDASFSKRVTRDPEDQANIVANVASAMAAAGLELNMQTYGKMIFLLLRSDATDAAMAVVNHLYNRNLELSPHIYTMLVEHCFAQNPPKLDSVHLFVQRRRHLDFDDMDHVFYDRVVRGYTQVGEVSAALDVYRHVVGSSATMSLPALTDLLRALLRQDLLDSAREMVNREKKRFEGQYPDPEGHESYWNHQFWQLASGYNLLDSELPSLRVSAVGAAEGNNAGTAVAS